MSFGWVIIVWSPRNLRGLADIRHNEEVGVPHFYPFFDPLDPLQCLIKCIIVHIKREVKVDKHTFSVGKEIHLFSSNIKKTLFFISVKRKIHS